MKLKQATFIPAHSGEIMKSHLDILENGYLVVIRQNITEVKGVMDELVGSPKVWKPTGETLYVPQGLLRIHPENSISYQTLLLNT